jgi:hypothetical protein
LDPPVLGNWAAGVIFWYDKDEAEWVILLRGKARLEYEKGTPKGWIWDRGLM